nr:hypothetical protein Ccrd_021576 [Ipomoea batatas]
MLFGSFHGILRRSPDAVENFGRREEILVASIQTRSCLPAPVRPEMMPNDRREMKGINAESGPAGRLSSVEKMIIHVTAKGSVFPLAQKEAEKSSHRLQDPLRPYPSLPHSEYFGRRNPSKSSERPCAIRLAIPKDKVVADDGNKRSGGPNVETKTGANFAVVSWAQWGRPRRKPEPVLFRSLHAWSFQETLSISAINALVLISSKSVFKDT